MFLKKWHLRAAGKRGESMMQKRNTLVWNANASSPVSWHLTHPCPADQPHTFPMQPLQRLAAWPRRLTYEPTRQPWAMENLPTPPHNLTSLLAFLEMIACHETKNPWKADHALKATSKCLRWRVLHLQWNQDLTYHWQQGRRSLVCWTKCGGKKKDQVGEPKTKYFLRYSSTVITWSYFINKIKKPLKPTPHDSSQQHTGLPQTKGEDQRKQQ